MLTRRQQEVYEYLKTSILKNGYAPSLEEIAAHFGLSSVATVHEHLTNLETKNMIRREFNRNRAIEVLPISSDSRVVELPILGRVAAGQPIEALDGAESVSVPEHMLGRGETFVLRVQGDSMIDELIRDGDLVVVESRDSAENGETVIALLSDGEVTLKKFYREGDRIRLQPANPSVDPIILPDERIHVQGVVIGVIRSYRA